MFSRLCDSDPILDFLRDMYSAVPLKVPDPRVEPLALFSIHEDRARYLGGFYDLVGSTSWNPPAVDVSSLGELAVQNSRAVSWRVAIDVLAPYLTQLLELTGSGTELKSSIAPKSDQDVSITLGSTERRFVHPIAFAASIDSLTVQLPKTLDSQIGQSDEKPLLLVDSVITAKEVTFSVQDCRGQAALVELESNLTGRVAGESLLRSNTRLRITGKNRSTFAFTCVQLKVNLDGIVSGIRIPDELPKAAATAVASIHPIPRFVLGERNEFFAFD